MNTVEALGTACRVCGAKPNEPCQLRNGVTTTDVHPSRRISMADRQRDAELAIRNAYTVYLNWQPDGDWSTFMSFAQDEVVR